MAQPEVALRVHAREELGVDAHELPSAFSAAIGRPAERSMSKSIVRQVAIVLVACAVTYTIGELVDVDV